MAMSLSSDQSSVDHSFNSPSGLQILISLGDITAAVAEGIVVPEGKSFGNLGFVAKALIDIDSEFAEKRDKLIIEHKASFKLGQVYTTKLRKRFKYVLHAIVSPCRNHEDVTEWEKQMTMLYQRIFKKADKNTISVLAVPLLGSGSRINGRLSDVTTNAETVDLEETGQSVKQDSHALAEAKIPFPPSWTRMTSNSELVTVSSGCQEYQDVGRRFLSSIGRGQHRTILEIKRVQSKTLWQLYCAKKQDIDSQDPGVQNERVLWHGTKKNSVLPISKKGFDRGFSGQNAARYGDGVYFAPASSYAAEDTYSVPDDNGHKYVFQARVLTGTYAKGERGMRVPPWRNEEQHLTYDSVVDNVRKPNLYVIFHDAQAYPEYLVTFT